MPDNQEEEFEENKIGFQLHLEFSSYAVLAVCLAYIIGALIRSWH